MAAMRDAAVAATQPFDFVLSPGGAVRGLPGRVGQPAEGPQRPFEHIAFQALPWNMSQQPAASVNAGWNDAGLPIGLQIVGRRHDDLGVLRLGRLWSSCAGRSGPGLAVVAPVDDTGAPAR